MQMKITSYLCYLTQLYALILSVQHQATSIYVVNYLQAIHYHYQFVLLEAFTQTASRFQVGNNVK